MTQSETQSQPPSEQPSQSEQQQRPSNYCFRPIRDAVIRANSSELQLLLAKEADEKKDPGLFAAFRAGQDVIEEIHNQTWKYRRLMGIYHPFRDHALFCKYERRVRNMEKLLVSFEKETKLHNTSVTSGIAMQLFKLGTNTSKIGILNCGTGGIKYQFYENTLENGITVLGEEKPETVSLNELVIPELYVPSGKLNKLDEALVKQKIIEDLKNIAKKCIINSNDMQIFAMITGPMRKAYEDANQDCKDRMNKFIKDLFDQVSRELSLNVPISPCTENDFFITQEMEGNMECMAVDNLIKGLGGQGVGSVGFGRGSTQIAFHTINSKGEYVLKVLQFPAGMNEPERLKEVKSFVENAFKDEEFVDGLVRMLETTDIPVIGLKSGALLLVKGPVKDFLVKNS